MDDKSKQDSIDIITKGLWNVTARLIRILCISFIVLTVVKFSLGYFDTDSTDGDSRSGMGLHIDNLTGCHYLTYHAGGITPRLKKDGSHFCSTEEEIK